MGKPQRASSPISSKRRLAAVEAAIAAPAAAIAKRAVDRWRANLRRLGDPSTAGLVDYLVTVSANYGGLLALPGAPPEAVAALREGHAAVTTWLRVCSLGHDEPLRVAYSQGPMFPAGFVQPAGRHLHY